MFYKKTILITGGTGYLGSRLVQSLVNNGHKILLLKRKKNTDDFSCGNLKNTIFFSIEDGIDIPFRNFNNIDIVIHLATAYDNKVNSHKDIDFVNFMYPSDLINLAVSNGVKYFINTDTSLPPEINYYTFTKRKFRDYASNLIKSNIINFINIKIEYIYGESMTHSNLPYYLITSCLMNTPVINLSKGDQKRDFIHVDDVVWGYVNIINNIDSIKYTNFEIGLGAGIRIKDLAIYIKTACDSSSNLNFGCLPYRENEVMESVAKIDAIKSTGWNPKYSLKDGLNRVIFFEKDILRKL